MFSTRKIVKLNSLEYQVKSIKKVQNYQKYHEPTGGGDLLNAGNCIVQGNHVIASYHVHLPY